MTDTSKKHYELTHAHTYIYDVLSIICVINVCK